MAAMGTAGWRHAWAIVDVAMKPNSILLVPDAIRKN
jgi:hypothetical protein